MSSKDIDLLRLCVAFPHIQKINDFLNVLSFFHFIKRICTVKQNDIWGSVNKDDRKYSKVFCLKNSSHGNKIHFSQNLKKWSWHYWMMVEWMDE